MLRNLMAAAVALAAAGMILAWAGAAFACDGAGVIIRIEGLPQDVQIERTENGDKTIVSRPRVLEVVCHDDIVRISGSTFVVLSIDGAGTVRVDHSVAYTVPPRSGAPSFVGNAYRSINDQVLPDMKRLPWNVRIKGAGDDFGFALPALMAGQQKLQAGDRTLLVRLVGGTTPYTVEVRDARGALVASQVSSSHTMALPSVHLQLGAYQITASDSTPRSLEAQVTVVADGPPGDKAFASITNAEVRAAAATTALARDATATWSFEAEQELNAAPAMGLDRDKVYELIENYSAD